VKPNIKIYNESNNVVSLEEITTDKNIISILEIQGIKFTSRNFQIEIELKQLMILNNEPIFESCLIKNSFNNKKETLLKTDLVTEENKILFKNESSNNNLEKTDIYNNLDDLDNLDNLNVEDNLDKSDNLDKLDNTKETIKNDLEEQNINQENKDNLESLDIKFEELNTEEFNDPKELKEFDLSNTLENTLETISLKKPNEVYKVLYEKAKNKAKMAKKELIIAYLEAKKIKNTYMIENIDNSDSDFEAELDEVSESELDNL
jgi:hypothetical protein